MITENNVVEEGSSGSHSQQFPGLTHPMARFSYVVLFIFPWVIFRHTFSKVSRAHTPIGKVRGVVGISMGRFVNLVTGDGLTRLLPHECENTNQELFVAFVNIVVRAEAV